MNYNILYIAYTFLAIAVIINLLLSGVRPTKTLAWLLVILLLPFLGMILYVGMGRNRRKNKFFKLKNNKAVQQHFKNVDNFYRNIEKEVKSHSSEIQENLKLSKLIIKNSRFVPYDGNKVTLLRNGKDTFESIFKALSEAKHFIHFQFYIYEEGEILDRITSIFEQKIKEGVKIRMIYDGIGSRKLSNRHIRKLTKMGVQVYGFMPIRFGRTIPTVNYRNHRKIIVIDGRVGFTGGINIADRYLRGDELGTWYDTFLRLEGSVVTSLQAVFAMDWLYAGGREELMMPIYFPEMPFSGESTVQIVSSGPDSDFASVRQQYFTFINQAKEYVYIANPYLIPGEGILEALQTAALSGVEVRLLVPKKSDNSLVKWSTRAYYQELMEAGVRIFPFPLGFLHSKTIVSDDTITSVGTANLDIRSFEQNFEINAVIFDRGIASELKKYFLEDCDQSEEIKLEDFLKRSGWDKLREGMAKIFSPLL